MSTLTVVECDERTCANNDDGYCSCSWISLLGQKCMSYEYDSDKDGDEEDE